MSGCESVADPEISKRGGGVLQERCVGHPRNSKKFKCFGVSDLEFYSHLMISFGRKGDSPLPPPLNPPLEVELEGVSERLSFDAYGLIVVLKLNRSASKSLGNIRILVLKYIPEIPVSFLCCLKPGVAREKYTHGF
jgi:hypothetical protein